MTSLLAKQNSNKFHLSLSHANIRTFAKNLIQKKTLFLSPPRSFFPIQSDRLRPLPNKKPKKELKNKLQRYCAPSLHSHDVRVLVVLGLGVLLVVVSLLERLENKTKLLLAELVTGLGGVVTLVVEPVLLSLLVSYFNHGMIWLSTANDCENPDYKHTSASDKVLERFSLSASVVTSSHSP
jgi:hypothetical protein